MTDTQFPGTGLLDVDPNDKDPELSLALRAKGRGMSKRQYVTLRADAILLTGRVLKWNSATFDEAFLALRLIAAQVWDPQQ